LRDLQFVELNVFYLMLASCSHTEPIHKVPVWWTWCSISLVHRK